MHRYPLAPALILACACAGSAPVANLVEPASSPATAAPAVPAPAAPSSAPSSGEPEAARLAQAWFDQLLGFDALEAYEVRGGKGRFAFAIARKWHSDGVRIVLQVLEPQSMDELAFLFLQNRDRSDDLFMYLTPQLFPGGGTEQSYSAPARKVRRMQGPRLEFTTPFTDQGIPIGELRPFLRDELDWWRFPDETIAGERCRVVVGRPRLPRFGFEGLELAISERSGVALRTRYFRGDEVQLSVHVDPADVRPYLGHLLPSRRRVESPRRGSFDLVLRNVIVDAALPDRLFSSHTIRFQKFPKF